jgi:hypothetical protein
MGATIMAVGEKIDVEYELGGEFNDLLNERC